MNPVVLIDEIDKLQAGGWRGDPASALLEVLDPAQNHTFRDHYLELDLDLSDVLFLTTANVLDTIPGPLLDRMEIVQLDGYTEDEKVAIAQAPPVPAPAGEGGAARRRARQSPTPRCTRSSAAGRARPGCADLERQLGKIARKAARKVAGGRRRRRSSSTSTRLNDYVGRPRFHDEDATRAPVPGLATGSRGHGCRRRRADDRGDRDGRRARSAGDRPARRRDVGVGADRAVVRACERRRARRRRPTRSSTASSTCTCPSGAVPKDGPSAGITMTTALASLVTGRPVKPGVGMTGEVTLQGRVLPIGGLKQKVLAAHRAGLTDVVMPIDNEPDLDDVPEAVRDALYVPPRARRARGARHRARAPSRGRGVAPSPRSRIRFRARG